MTVGRRCSGCAAEAVLLTGSAAGGSLEGGSGEVEGRIMDLES